MYWKTKEHIYKWLPTERRAACRSFHSDVSLFNCTLSCSWATWKRWQRAERPLVDGLIGDTIIQLQDAGVLTEERCSPLTLLLFSCFKLSSSFYFQELLLFKREAENSYKGTTAATKQRTGSPKRRTVTSVCRGVKQGHF